MMLHTHFAFVSHAPRCTRIELCKNITDELVDTESHDVIKHVRKNTVWAFSNNLFIKNNHSQAMYLHPRNLTKYKYIYIYIF